MNVSVIPEEVIKMWLLESWGIQDGDMIDPPGSVEDVRDTISSLLGKGILINSVLIQRICYNEIHTWRKRLTDRDVINNPSSKVLEVANRKIQEFTQLLHEWEVSQIWPQQYNIVDVKI